MRRCPAPAAPKPRTEVAVTHIGVVACAAGGVEEVRSCLVEPLIRRGYGVGVTLTPEAARWLGDLGEVRALEEVTGLPVRSVPRLPREPRPHPPADRWVVAPASAGSVAKLALGIGDNQAMTQVCEAMGQDDVPVVVFPHVNAAHARHPVWERHLGNLRRGGVRLVYGDDVWPLAEPRARGCAVPWQEILEAVTR